MTEAMFRIGNLMVLAMLNFNLWLAVQIFVFLGWTFYFERSMVQNCEKIKILHGRSTLRTGYSLPLDDCKNHASELSSARAGTRFFFKKKPEKENHSFLDYNYNYF